LARSSKSALVDARLDLVGTTVDGANAATLAATWAHARRVAVSFIFSFLYIYIFVTMEEKMS